MHDKYCLAFPTKSLQYESNRIPKRNPWFAGFDVSCKQGFERGIQYAKCHIESALRLLLSKRTKLLARVVEEAKISAKNIVLM